MPTLSPAAATLTFTGSTPTLKTTIYPTPGQIVFRQQSPVISSVLTVSSGNKVYINAVDYGKWRANSFHMVGNISSGWTVTFELEHVTGGTLPKYRDEVIMFWKGIRRFAGLVTTVKSTSRMGRPTQSVVTVTCSGYQAYTDDVVVAKLYRLDGLQGGVPSIIVEDIQMEHLAQFGITFSSEGNPADLLPDQPFVYVSATECLNRLRDQCPGYAWWIDFSKRLHFKNTVTASPDAPFSISRALLPNTSFSLTTSGAPFRNRMFVLPSVDLNALRTDSFTGNGSQFVFITQYNIDVKPIVTVAGVTQIVTEAGNWISGWQVYYIPGNLGVYFASPPAGAAAIEVRYPNPFPLAAMVEDTASIATYGLKEDVFHAKNAASLEAAAELGQALLEAYSALGPPQSVEATYDEHHNADWLTPGMVVAALWTEPTVNANFTVEEVESNEIGLTTWRHRVVLRSGAGDITEARAMEAFRGSMRFSTSVWPVQATMEIAVDIPGITNPGLATGLQPNTYRFRGSGIIASWDARFSVTPPTGATIIIDLLLNGTSVFLAGNANKIIIPIGSTTEQSGITFLTDNIPYVDGDLLTMNVIQVGSTEPGKNGLVHLNIKPNTAIPPI